MTADWRFRVLRIRASTDETSENSACCCMQSYAILRLARRVFLSVCHLFREKPMHTIASLGHRSALGQRPQSGSSKRASHSGRQ